MTVLIGDIKDVGLKPTEGTVTVFSARTRRANGAGGVITRERRDYVLSGGRFRTAELDPGRTTVELVAPGVFESWTFDLPTDGTVSLVDAVELSVDYAPDSAVVNGAAAAAAKAERWAGEAAGSAAVAGRARDEAVAAQASVSRVVESAVTVVRGEFTDLTERAVSAADRAEVARDAAASSAEGAAGSVSAAEASAGKAAGSASAAEESAGRADGSAKTAANHAQAAESSAGAAESSASAARSSADAAASSLGDVNTAVSTATAARTGAELARDEAVHAAESAKTGAPVGGWDIGSLSQGVRESLGRADSAITVVPTATGSSAGGVKLSGDLGGTWDAPTVPGLAGKLDKQAVSESVTAGSLVQRTEGGQVKAATPQADDDATTKAYVDGILPKYEYDYNPTPLTMALRTGTGTMRVGDAVGAKDAVTKAQLDALAARVAALESTAVTSTTYRKIAKGTGTSTDTIYIQE
ncbi:hypothetical protein [uncultured Corynebacterium sp.]|uniref:hypothetical protein n=1 Tax=uncultured Corynebacterium sp. TaxID=159447 RepID=UPI0025939945|nr:hypothetical protein [uncultured Corynebacterium sp.]